MISNPTILARRHHASLISATDERWYSLIFGGDVHRQRGKGMNDITIFEKIKPFRAVSDTAKAVCDILESFIS